MTAFGTILAVLNALLIAGSGALALVLWRYGKVEVGAIAMVLPLTSSSPTCRAGSPSASPTSSKRSASCRKA